MSAAAVALTLPLTRTREQALTSATLVVFTKSYVAYGVVALLIELHSSVLHSRVLFKMYSGPSGSATESKYYQWIKYTNMVFFFLFRFSALLFMAYGMWRDRRSAPSIPIFLFMSLAVGIILFLSVLLFFRVFRSDFLMQAPVADKTFEAFKDGLSKPGDPAPPLTSTSSSITSISSSVNQQLHQLPPTVQPQVPCKPVAH